MLPGTPENCSCRPMPASIRWVKYSYQLRGIMAPRPIEMQAGVGRPPPQRPALMLVSMPFFTVERPSLQLGLLSAIARQRGFHADTLHLTLDFAVRIGVDLYESLSEYARHEFGNWLFSSAAFPDDAPDPEGRLLALLAPDVERFHPLGGDAASLLRIRNEVVPDFLDHAEQCIDWARYDVVGFTSTFQQNAASFALARRLKQRHP